MCLNSTLFLFSVYSAFSTSKMTLENGWWHSISDSYSLLILQCSCDNIHVPTWDRWIHCVSKENLGGHCSSHITGQRAHASDSHVAMDLLFHILLKRWTLQDLDILKTRKLVKEDLFSKALFISAAVSPVPSSRHPYGISSINQFLSFLLFCYRCLCVILCLYCPYCSHTLP